ncbi:MAG TPA: site-2 protease family protein [Ferruginibacter sp.]|nr:site-2 protease family protein [Ferruginibacter sp.]
MNENNDLTSKPDEKSDNAASLPRTAMSLMFFVLLYYWLFQSWTVVIALIIVLLIHESGHFIAMKFFGYKGVNMTFVPFVGAYVSGEAMSLSNRNKIIVLLAGPVPGIIMGIILLVLHHQNQQENFYLFAIVFLLQNTFNLLPILPLDGGQFFQALFFNIGRTVQLVFLYVLLALFIFAAFYWARNQGYLLFALLVAFKINRTHYLQRVHKKLDALNVDYACNYEDLTDDEYWQIRNTVISENRRLTGRFTMEEYADNEHELIPYVEKVLVVPFEDTLTTAQKALFLLIWAAAFVSPFLVWSWHKGGL